VIKTCMHTCTQIEDVSIYSLVFARFLEFIALLCLCKIGIVGQQHISHEMVVFDRWVLSKGRRAPRTLYATYAYLIRYA
jgi:hypothetical protein